MAKSISIVKSQQSEKLAYFHGFDFLRIIFALFVVLWHMQTFGPSSTYRPVGSIPGLVDVIYYNVLLIAVPVFVLLSLFLYIYNRSRNNGHYLVHRVGQLGFLYMFWTIAAMAILMGGIKLENFKSPDFIAGGFITYFLLILIINTVIMEGLVVLKQRLRLMDFVYVNVTLFIIACLLMVFRLQVSEALWFVQPSLLLEFYSPLNFLPYPFLGALLYTIYEKWNKKILGLNGQLSLFLVMVLLIIAEWMLMPADGAYLLPPYARLSLVAASSLFLVFFLNLNVDGGRIVRTLASLTLGVYLLHLFVYAKLSATWPDLWSMVVGDRVSTFIAVISLSFLLAYCVKKVGIV